MSSIEKIVNVEQHPLDSIAYRAQCKSALDEEGVLVLSEFLTPEAIEAVVQEGVQQQSLAYYTVSDHNAYLKPKDDAFAVDHPRNRLVSSSKGCITKLIQRRRI